MSCSYKVVVYVMLGSVGGGSWISSIESGGGREGGHTHYPDFGYHIHQWVKSKGTLAKDIYLCKIVIPFRTAFFFIHSSFFFGLLFGALSIPGKYVMPNIH